MQNKNQLILELDRIKDIMGVELLTEAPTAQLVDEFLNSLNKILKETGDVVVDTAIRNFKSKLYNAARQNRRLLIGDAIDDLVKISKNEILGEAIGKGLMKLYPEADNIVQEVLNKVDIKQMDPTSIRVKFEQAFDQYYAAAGRNIQSPLYIKMRDLILNRKYLSKLKNARTWVDKAISIISPDAVKMFKTLTLRWFRTADDLQKKFIQVSDRAVSKIEKGDDITGELKEMFSILASTKQWWWNQPSWTMEAWLQDDFFKTHPKGPALKTEFDTYVKQGDYKELYDILTKGYPDIFQMEYYIDLVKRYRTLWPFKAPKSPDGYWIFSNKFSPSRVATLLAVKSSRNLMDFNKLLLARGVKAGSIRWLMMRFAYIYVLHPLFVSYLKSAIDWSEEAASWLTGLYGGEPVDWVDFTNVPDEFRKQSYIFMKEVGEEYGKNFTWWDNQTYLNEIVYIHNKLFGGKNPEQSAKEMKDEYVRQSSFAGPEVQDALRTGQVGQSNNNTTTQVGPVQRPSGTQQGGTGTGSELSKSKGKK